MMVYARDRSMRIVRKRRQKQPNIWDGFEARTPPRPYRSDEKKEQLPSKLDEFLRTSDTRCAYVTPEERESMREAARLREAFLKETEE